jgi:hypothetical protein
MYPFLESLAFSLTPEYDIHVLPPTRTYCKTLVSSTVTPVPIHADSPSTSFQMSAVQPSQTGLVYVIPFTVTFVNMSIFQIHEVHHISAFILLILVYY